MTEDLFRLVQFLERERAIIAGGLYQDNACIAQFNTWIAILHKLAVPCDGRIVNREDAPELFSTLQSGQIHQQARAIRAYIAMSQGRLYNPRLSEMLDELIKICERR